MRCFVCPKKTLKNKNEYHYIIYDTPMIEALTTIKDPFIK